MLLLVMVQQTVLRRVRMELLGPDSVTAFFPMVDMVLVMEMDSGLLSVLVETALLRVPMELNGLDARV